MPLRTQVKTMQVKVATAGAKGGVAQDLGQLGGICGGGAVEAVPAEPEDEAPQRAHGQGVPGDGVDLDAAVLFPGVLTDPGAQHPRADKGSQSAHHVDHRGAGEVHIAELDQPALAVPDPPGLDGVDHRADDAGVHAVGQEFGALRHGAGDDGGRCGAEHQLEKEVRPVEGIEVRKHLILRHADQAEEIVLTVHDAVAQQDEDHRSDAEIH